MKINIKPYLYKKKKYYKYNIFIREHIVTRLVPLFLWIGLTPNELQIISIVYSIFVSVLFISPNPIYWIIASILMLGCLVLDKCDGVIARYKGIDSEFGRFTDHITGKITYIFNLVGMSLLFKSFVLIGFIGIISALLTSLFVEKTISYTSTFKERKTVKDRPFISFHLYNFYYIVIVVSVIDLFCPTNLRLGLFLAINLYLFINMFMVFKKLGLYEFQC